MSIEGPHFRPWILEPFLLLEMESYGAGDLLINAHRDIHSTWIGLFCSNMQPAHKQSAEWYTAMLSYWDQEYLIVSPSFNPMVRLDCGRVKKISGISNIHYIIQLMRPSDYGNYMEKLRHLPIYPIDTRV